MIATDKSFWVVEKFFKNELHYWTALRRNWTKDIGMATRMADEESASGVLYNTCCGEGRVAEHMTVKA